VSDDLAGGVVAFATRLRCENGYGVVPGQAHDALRALEAIGVEPRARVRAALRSVFSATPTEFAAFDEHFDAFFSSGPAGAAQPEHARRGRPDDAGDPPEQRDREGASRPPGRSPQDDDAGVAATEVEPHEESLAQAWMAMQARYSPAAAARDVATIPQQGLEAAYAAAERLIARTRLGRSRRWRPLPRGERFDLRRTLRASLRTGGDAMVLHRLGRPLRNPRFVVLLDGSRSMEPYAGTMLQFALALCRRSRRAEAFLFSTELRAVTRELREAAQRGAYRLNGLGDAWGGGTRIGASLSDFVRRYGSRLTDETYAIVFSDGLDVGEIADLERAMREIRRRSAAVAWVNPHAGTPGYAPAVRGMRAALPFVDVFTGLDALEAL